MVTLRAASLASPSARAVFALGFAITAGCAGYYERRVIPPPPSGDAPPEALAPAPPADAPPPPADAPPPPVDADAPPGAPPAGSIAIEPLPPPPPPARMPALAFRSPRPNEAISKAEAERYLVRLDVTDFALAPGGQHLHVLLDDQPYKPVDNATASVRLGDIAPDHPLAEGEHVLVAFPATRDNISIKPDQGKTPLARVAFWVGKPGKPRPAGKEPRVVLSRPKGTYNGAAADGILLDFYLIDARIGPSLGAVRASITPPVGEARTLELTRWIPHEIRNLPDGDTRVRLELLDASGARLPGRFSAAEQIITVNRAAVGEGTVAAVPSRSSRAPL
jgi:hypothetical protein